ncbi:MAG: hypothetical protein HN344_04870 [Gammaproteobacteria bacterium]|jgi:AmpE protein|nr:hypothetical protein [Gammaproteobacteria bacterium]
MTLLSIIFVLTIERYYRVLDEYRKLSWFTRWSLWVREHRELDSRLSGWVISLLTLLVPVLLVHQLAQWMADGGWLPELLFGMLILILSLGPRDLREQVESVLESWSSEDLEGGILHAEGLLDGELPEEKRGLIRKLTEAVLTEANPRIFGVLFWFLTVGPAAALLFRLARILEERQMGGEDEPPLLLVKMNHLLAWPAAHLLALSYALVGDFSSAFRRIVEHAGDWSRNHAVMRQAGVGAIRLDDPLAESDEDLQEVWDALEIVRRAEVAWVALMALLVLVGSIHT